MAAAFVSMLRRSIRHKGLCPVNNGSVLQAAVGAAVTPDPRGHRSPSGAGRQPRRQSAKEGCVLESPVLAFGGVSPLGQLRK